ncbi:hypothetical protein VTL71DRAFT_14526 [Oculimacula yallundae]|uniref:Nephrocystin 3-like N-terminal domain-containing protein n=1 Tax=Oculimacula yallundae TaxID=86028 RepID=A0ABR4CIQ4_9HELO
MAPTTPTVQNGVNARVPNGNSSVSTTTTTKIEPTKNVTNGEFRKITMLKDVVQQTLTTHYSELGSSTDEFLDSCTTVDQFFDYVASIRLRQIPHPSSRWDQVLTWAEFFVAQVHGYSVEAAEFVAHSDYAASIIWASCRGLLELGRENVDILEKVFGSFYECGLSLGLFTRHHEHIHHTEELQIILGKCYVDLLRLVTGINLYYSRKQLNTVYSAKDFFRVFGRRIDTFLAYSDQFTATIWKTRLESLAKPGDVSFELVHGFLTPHDRVTRLLTTTRMVRKHGADFTCEWFDLHLAAFLRGDRRIMIVSGRPGTGKTFLSGWTVERLQTLTGRHASDVLSYSIDPDMKNDLTTLSVVKGLLLQLLHFNVGDNELYKSLAHAYELSRNGGSDSQIENGLWTALQIGLTSGRNHTIVIDGVDQVKGKNADVSKLLAHLEAIVTSKSKIKILLFSRTLSDSITQKHEHLAITSDYTRQDIRYFAESLLASSVSPGALSEDDKQKAIASLTETSDGSFEWVIQAINIIKTETTSASIMKKLSTLPKTLDAIIAQVISSVDLAHQDTRSLLAWLLVSQRPLLLTEIRQLFEIDSTKAIRTPRNTRVEDDVVKALGPLITIRKGIVRFSNPMFKAELLKRASSVTDTKNTGASLLHIQEAHCDMTERCLAYVKMSLTRPAEPTLSHLNDYELDELFAQYDLLQYAARYWAWHFEASHMHEPTVQHKLTGGFKGIFPHTTMLAIIEGSCFTSQSSSQDAINHHLLTLSVRRMVLGEKSEAVLQTLLNLAVSKEITLHVNEVNEYYYEAWRTSQSLKLTGIAFKCAQRYITKTSTIKITSQSTVATRRCEMLEYVIDYYIETRQSQTKILGYLETLVTLYVTIGKTERVTSLRKQIYDINVQLYGSSAPQTTISRDAMITTISGSNCTESSEVIEKITESSYQEACHTLTVSDPKRIEVTWSMIDIYTRRNDSRRAEELLVWLWQSWTHYGMKNQDSKTHQQRTDIALRYVQFLKLHDRKFEAENILRGVVTDLEHTECHDEEILKRRKFIAIELVALGCVAAARGVFTNLWAYYVKSGKMESSEAKAVSTQLEETTSRGVTECLTETDTESQRYIFDSVMTKTTTTKVDSIMVQRSTSLCETYYQEQRWDQVITVSTITITRLWTGWTSTEIRTSFPASYLEETIKVIRYLYTSYLKTNQTVKAEETVRKLFYGVLCTQKTSDDLLISTSKELVDFYESRGMWDKTIIVYKDLCAEVEKRKGKTAALTIKTLYSLGDSGMRINDTKCAEFAYSTIYTNLGSDVCHREAIRAAQTLTVICEQQHRHTEARKIYSSIWQMFLKHGKDYDLQPDWSADLYEKYVRNLKRDSKTEYETVRDLAVEYRKALVALYGVKHETTIKATLGLAEICEEKSEHRLEAIAMYEEADKQSREVTKGQLSKSALDSITYIRKRLPHLYSTSDLATSPKAIPLYEAQWQIYYAEKGHSHGEALKWLSLLVIAHAKQDNPDAKNRAISTLRTSVVNILKNEKDSQRLWNSGVRLASIYTKAGLKTEAKQLLQQLRSQIIFGDSPESKDLAFAAGKSLERRTWVFIVTFQCTLQDTKHMYTATMSDLINEMFLYESYCRLVSQKAAFLETIGYGARLLQFMRDINDEASHARVEKDFLDYFGTNLSATKSVNVAVLREFFEIVLLYVHRQDIDVKILNAGSKATAIYYDKGRHIEAYDMAFLTDRFQQIVGGYDSIEKFTIGLKIALLVGGYKKMKVTDGKVKSAMNELSGSITKQLVKESRANRILLVDVSLNELGTLVGLLGEMGNLDDLEYILNLLWQSRATRTSWPAATVVSLGRRLVEVKFARGQHASAIHLCEDMCYNVRRVWGALDATTLDMHILLAELFTSSDQHAKAMRVHEDILRDAASDKGEEIDQAQAAAIAVRHLDLLKRTYQRLGKWDKQPQSYLDLYQQLAHVFGSEENWKNARIQPIEKWSAKGADNLGVWTKPNTFEWVESEGKRKHVNYLRRSLGHAGNLGFQSGKLLRSYSSRSEVAAQ